MASLVRQVDVAVPPERAFTAFVDIQDVLHWLADGAVIGRRVGGRWGLGWYADEDSDAGYHTIGVVETYDPGHRLVVASLTFSTPEGEELGPMRLVVDFEGLPAGGTRVTVTQDGLLDSPSWEGYTAGVGPGWDRSLLDLKGWLEDGRALPGRQAGRPPAPT